MSDAREQVLTNIRAALHREGPLPDSVARSLRGRLSRPRANLKPAIGDDATAHFIEKLESVSAKVTRVASIGKVAEVVARHLESFHLSRRSARGSRPAPRRVAWPLPPGPYRRARSAPRW